MISEFVRVRKSSKTILKFVKVQKEQIGIYHQALYSSLKDREAIRMDSPFNPNFGRMPNIFIDRDEIIDKITDGLKSSGSPYQTTIICGVRGVGKTALLTDITREMSKDSSWIIADVSSREDIITAIIKQVKDQADSFLLRALESIDGFSVSIGGAELSTSKDKTEHYDRFMLADVLDKISEKGKHVLVTIDEAEASPDIKEFARVYNMLIRKDYPISCLMTGLPKNISELQNDPILTFLLRSKRVDLPMLGGISVFFAYKDIFTKNGRTADDSVLKEMTKLTGGYSYAFQLLGYLIWDTQEKVVTKQTLESVMDEYRKMLFKTAYTKIYEELSEVDKNFMNAMAASTERPVPMKFICEQMDKKPNYVSTYRRRLLDAGIINVTSYGYVDFALPLFDNYIEDFYLGF